MLRPERKTPLPAILFRTPTQVNAKALFQEVHAAEEGWEEGSGRYSRHALQIV